MPKYESRRPRLRELGLGVTFSKKDIFKKSPTQTVLRRSVCVSSRKSFPECLVHDQPQMNAHSSVFKTNKFA